jgi:putative transcriptional regulator
VLTAEALGPDDEQRQIVPGVLLSVSRTLALRLLQEPPSSRTKVVVGYAGWRPGQLEHEIAASAWLTTDVDPGLIFGVPADQMWERAIRRLGADPANLQTSSGVH